MTDTGNHPDAGAAAGGASANYIDAGDAELEPVADARAHISLFVPTIIVAILFGGSWCVLWGAGLEETRLARVSLLVFLLAPPLLLVQAFLKYHSTGLAVTDCDLLVAPGWPRQSGVEVPLLGVDSVDVSASWLTRWFDTGTVRIRLVDGDVLKVSDLARAKQMTDYIRTRLRQARAAQTAQ